MTEEIKFKTYLEDVSSTSNEQFEQNILEMLLEVFENTPEDQKKDLLKRMKTEGGFEKFAREVRNIIGVKSCDCLQTECNPPFIHNTKEFADSVTKRAIECISLNVCLKTAPGGEIGKRVVEKILEKFKQLLPEERGKVLKSLQTDEGMAEFVSNLSGLLDTKNNINFWEDRGEKVKKVAQEMGDYILEYVEAVLGKN